MFSGIALTISIILIFYHAFAALNAVSDVIIDKILFHKLGSIELTAEKDVKKG